MRWKSTPAAWLVVGLCALLLLRSARQLAAHPAYNYDLLGYVGLALEWSEDDPAEVHARTYAEARATLPPEAQRELTGAGVRAARARDAEAFTEHLAFFRARVLYTGLLAGLGALGAPLVEATWWIPLASWLAAAVLFHLWLARALGPALGALVALGLAHLPALLRQAGYSTPDGLAMLLVCLAGYLLVERRSFLGASVALLAALAARPDTVILAGFLPLALALYLPAAERPRLRALVALPLLAGALYLGLARFAGEYGYWPLFTISFEEKSVHPASLPTAIDWAKYAAVLDERVGALPGAGYYQTQAGGEITGSSLLFPFGALALAGAVLGGRARARHGRAAALLAALLATYLVRFLLFPQAWDRFFAAFYALVPLVLLASLARELRARPVPSHSFSPSDS